MQYDLKMPFYLQVLFTDSFFFVEICATQKFD